MTALALSNPTPKSFHLFQNSTIGNPSSYHPQLDAFNASLSLNGGKPYGIITLPHVHATKEAYTVVDQDVAITDMEAFTAYSGAVLGSDRVKVDVKGRTALHEMRFPTAHVDYHKTATMDGKSDEYHPPPFLGRLIIETVANTPALTVPHRPRQTLRLQRHLLLHQTQT